MPKTIPEETVAAILQDAGQAKSAVDRAMGIVDRLRQELVRARGALESTLPSLPSTSYPYKSERSYRDGALDAIQHISKVLGDRP